MFDKEVTIKALEVFERIIGRLNSKRLLTFMVYLTFLGLVQHARAIELGSLAYVLTSLLVWKNGGKDELSGVSISTTSAA
jgi:hypothetical protein